MLQDVAIVAVAGLAILLAYYRLIVRGYKSVELNVDELERAAMLEQEEQDPSDEQQSRLVKKKEKKDVI
jgi:hypothetical protein